MASSIGWGAAAALPWMLMLKLLGALARRLPLLGRLLRERDDLRSQMKQLRLQPRQSLPQRTSAGVAGSQHAPGTLSFRAPQPNSTGRLPVFENHGYCYCCDSNVRFVAFGTWWRDEYVCSNCGSIPRERAIMYCIESFFPAWRDLVIHESSPVSRGASLRLKAECRGYFATQYFPDETPGTLKDDVRCENLESLTFEDASIDLHVTQDVFEHIFDPAKAFKEIARTLKLGGAHVFTVPIVKKSEPSEACARRTADGRVEHLREPEYHGNPISDQGSLVTTRWGYDICEFILKNSGLFTKVVILDALDLGIRAEYIDVLMAQKPGQPPSTDLNA